MAYERNNRNKLIMLGSLINLVLRFPESSFKDRIRSHFYGNVVSERIVEYTLVIANINFEPSTKVKILDVGSYFSNLPLQLASMGYSVTAIDLFDYQLTHPNLTFIKGDVTKYKFKERYFDLVTCVSTLEHIGLGYYEGDQKDLSLDFATVEVVHSILKKGGRFLLTIPFGVKSISSVQRVYDWETVKKLLEDFKIEKSLFYREKKGKWIKTSLDEALKISSINKTKAMAFVVATKER